MTFKEFIAHVAFLGHSAAIGYYKTHHPYLTEDQINDEITLHCRTAGITFWNLLSKEEALEDIDIIASTFGEEEVTPGKLFESVQEDVRYYNTIAVELGLPEKTISDFDFTTLISASEV